MVNDNQQRLELSWYNKDRALIPTESGRYGYTWVDPRDPRYCEARTLVMDEYVEGVQAPKVEGVVYSERADLEPTTDNLLILGESGDVLEALTRVPELRQKYVGKVRCIYIDPPFNTAQTFANYEDNLEHSVWLTLMRDRLTHMHRLLSREGAIWVHLDDVEMHRMRVLLDEVFGPGNFVGSVVWEKAPGAKGKTAMAASHDYITVYAKNRDEWTARRNLLPRTDGQVRRYANPDGDPRGPWRQGADGTAKSGGEDSRWPITLPSGRVVTPARGRFWAFSRDTFEKARTEGRVYFGRKGDGLPVIKTYLHEAQDGTVPVTWWDASDVGTNQEAKRDHLNRMFPEVENPFDTPKPERLLERIVHISTDPGDVVMDFFGGSGTTAAVAHKMGRRWVTCELSRDNFETFTRPRLEKVVRGQDPLGITRTVRRVEERRLKDGIDLPDGLTASDAWEIEGALNKASKVLESRIDLLEGFRKNVRADRRADESVLSEAEGVELIRLLEKFAGEGVTSIDFLPVVKRSVVQQIKTERLPGEINWLGGGGFQVAHLAPACFDFDPDFGVVTMTRAAQDPALLTASIAAHLRFRLTPEDRHFHGVRGAMRLYVTRDPLTPEYVTSLVSHLGEGESLTVASTVVLDGTSEALRKARRGSRVVHIPSDLFSVQTKGKR